MTNNALRWETGFCAEKPGFMFQCAKLPINVYILNRISCRHALASCFVLYRGKVKFLIEWCFFIATSSFRIQFMRVLKWNSSSDNLMIAGFFVRSRLLEGHHIRLICLKYERCAWFLLFKGRPAHLLLHTYHDSIRRESKYGDATRVPRESTIALLRHRSVASSRYKPCSVQSKINR